MLIYEKIFFFALGLLIGFAMSVIMSCLEISSANDIDDTMESADNDNNV